MYACTHARTYLSWTYDCCRPRHVMSCTPPCMERRRPFAGLSLPLSLSLGLWLASPRAHQAAPWFAIFYYMAELPTICTTCCY